MLYTKLIHLFAKIFKFIVYSNFPWPKSPTEMRTSLNYPYTDSEFLYMLRAKNALIKLPQNECAVFFLRLMDAEKWK